MNKLFILLSILGMVCFQPKIAKADICITSIKYTPAEEELSSNYSDGAYQLYDASFSNIPRCEDISAIRNATKVVSISLAVGGVYALCTGAGAPVSAVLAAGTAGTMFVELILDNVPCENNEADEAIERKVDELVCAKFSKMGVDCPAEFRTNKSVDMKGSYL